MRSFIDEMNNLAMLKADEMILKPQRVSIQNILTLSSERIVEFAFTQEKKLNLILPEEPILVNVDINKTTLAITNLLNNAIRFSPPGSEITVGAVRDGDEVLAWVQDRGRGIPKEDLQKIFEEFYQIEAQEGEIWAESEDEGAGAIFKVLLSMTP